MANEASQPLKVGHFVASIDLAGLSDRGQYHFVKISGTSSSSHFAVGELVLAGAGDHNILGVLQNNPKVGQPGEVVVIGETKVKAVGSITAGATLGPDATGLAQAVGVTGSTYTKSAVGIAAIHSDAAANDIITALVNCLNPLAGT